jgi:hypothetical protein
VRYFPLLCWFGLTLGFIACDTGSVAESSCASGLELCGSNCVPAGTCIGNSGGAPGSGGAAPVNTAPITSTACTDTASGAATISGQYAGTTLSANGGTKQYRLAANWWGKYNGQSIAYSGLSFTLQNPNAVASTDNNPIGYPTMYIGTYSGVDTVGSNLPKQVSALTTVPTVLSTNAAEGARDQFNAAYDVWFTPTSTKLGSGEYAPPAGGAYLMVWMFKPTMRQPRGSIRKSGQTIAGIAGKWNVWVDGTNPPCISYVSVDPINGLDFDLNAFIQDSVANSYGITSSMYLSVVFAGFEVWAGGDNLKIHNFCAKVD